MAYMSDDRRRDAAKRSGPEGLAPETRSCGVAPTSFGMTKLRRSRLAWPFFRGQRGDRISVNRP